MSSYIEFPIESDPETLAEAAFDHLQSLLPGWAPNDGNLDTIMIEAMARISAEVRDVASAVPVSIFRYFGTLLDTPPINASRATVTTSWSMIDSAGYTITAGTQVGIRTAGDVLVPFEVIQDYVIAPGTSARNDIVLRALTPGSAASSIGTPGQALELIDTLSYINTVLLNDTTSGGVDAETDTEYLDRLSGRLRLLSPRPILPADFAALALDVAGVARALAIDGYDPNTTSYNNERMVAVAVVDENGIAVGQPIKDQVAALLEGEREVNFVVNVIDPTYTYVDVTYSATASPGFNPSDVKSNVDSALALYFDPSNWGQPSATNDPSGPVLWRESNVARYLEVAQVINAVDGVDYITSLVIGQQGQALTQSDIVLTAPAALTRVGNISGTISAP